METVRIREGKHWIFDVTIEADSVNSMSRTFTLDVVLRRLLNGLPSVDVGPVDVCIHCIPQSFEEEPILGRFVRHV
jgi:hypothetical protein